jgi:hypothetical protein
MTHTRDALNNLDDEYDLQDYLQSELEAEGWRTDDEVSVRKDLSQPLSDLSTTGRADIVAEHPDFGTLGIETKFFRKNGGAMLADAHHQIVSKYRGQNFKTFGTVDLWAICPCFKPMYDEDCDDWYTTRGRERRSLTKSLFCRHGVGYVSLHARELFANFNHTDSEFKVPFNQEHDYYNPDMKKIREMVRRKMSEFDYGGSGTRSCQYNSTGGCTAPATESVEFINTEVEVCQFHAKAVEKELAFPEPIESVRSRND